MSDRHTVVRRKKPGKNLVMFLLSLALGGAGVFYSKHYIEERIAFYKGQLQSTETMVEIVVPNRSLVRGEIVRDEDLQKLEVPEQYVDAGTVTPSNFTTAVGQRIDFDVQEGRALLWAHLEGGLTPTFSGKVPEGLRAMTVRVDEINSISGFLQPNDRVDLLMSLGSGDDQRIVPLIEQLNVIATGTQTVTDKSFGTGQRVFSTITVQVTPHQAQKITLAQSVGTLTAMLRNPDDESPLGPNGMTVAELLGERVEEPAVVTPPAPRARAPRQPSPPRIEYIIGGQP